MAETDSDTKLILVAEALGDGQPVDWEGLAAREPEIAEELHGLRVVEKVAEAYRREIAAAGDEGTTETVPAAAGGARSRSWILIAVVAAALLALAVWLVRSR